MPVRGRYKYKRPEKCLICGKNFQRQPPEDLMHDKCYLRKYGMVGAGNVGDIPPPEVDPTREARLRRYEERAALELPLFEGAI